MCDRDWLPLGDAAVDVLFDADVMAEPYFSRFIALLADWADEPAWLEACNRDDVAEWLRWRPITCLLLVRLLRAWTHDERLD